jgi:hypothetical protein
VASSAVTLYELHRAALSPLGSIPERANTLSPAVGFDSLQIVKPIPIIAKDLLPLIALNDDVIKGSFELHSGFSSHSP